MGLALEPLAVRSRTMSKYPSRKVSEGEIRIKFDGTAKFALGFRTIPVSFRHKCQGGVGLP